MNKAQLVALIYQTPSNNSSYEFNCQTWVGAVLQNLAGRNYLLRDECSNAVDAMVDATLEGVVEP